MLRLSQNNKIAISAAAMFAISFSILLMFLTKYGGVDKAQNNVLNHGGGHGDGHSEEETHSESAWSAFVPESGVFLVVEPDGNFKYLSDPVVELLKIRSYDENSFFDYINSKDLGKIVEAETEMIHKLEPQTGIGPIRMLRGNEEVLVLINGWPILSEDQEHLEYIIFEIVDLSEKIEELKGESPSTEELHEYNEERMTAEKIGYRSE